MNRKTISIVIPFFNEALNLQKITSEVYNVAESLSERYLFEVLLLDNHSNDGSFDIACDIASKDPSTKVIRLSRNFGYQANILTGYRNAGGDAAIQLDADGEDDPALFHQFIQKWEEGYKVVYGIRKSRKESFVLSLQRKVFYRILARLSDIQIPLDAGDFRLIDRKVLDVLNSFNETSPYLRGLLSYAGFKQIGIPYERRPRYSGRSKFSWIQYLQLAIDGISTFSKKPLTWAAHIGLLVSTTSFIAIFFYLFLHFTNRIAVQGFVSLILVQLLFGGIQLLSIGLLGIYVGRIFEQVKGRPVSIVEDIAEAHEKNA